MKKIIHKYWSQGWGEIPPRFLARQEDWAEALPDFEFKLWDKESAILEWPELEPILGKCYHFATECDIVLAWAQYRYGGFSTGTDTILLDPDKLQSLMSVGSFVTLNLPGKSCANAFVYMDSPKASFISIVKRHQLRNGGKHLSSPNVWASTGPGCYWDVYSKHQRRVMGIPDSLAWSIVDPVMEGSWHKGE